jgi:hypothetical protein
MRTPDISRDFVHLSQTLSVCKEPYSYELVVILENCSEDAEYKEQAVSNLISYAESENRIKAQLINLAASDDKELERIKTIVREILKKINTPSLDSIANSEKLSNPLQNQNRSIKP